MKIHYLQHVPFEDLGYIRQWAGRQQHAIAKTSLYANEQFPEHGDFDCLVILGGPMGVNDTSQYPWLREEKGFIEGAMKAGKALLGICLGAQLIAHVLGARVFSNRYREIGWHVVSRTKMAEQSPLKAVFPETFNAFHWHGDTFGLPIGSVHLAASRACHHQAFSFGTRIMGLQYHLESLPESIEELIRHCGDELKPGPYIQSADDMLGESSLTASSNDTMESVLSYMEGQS